MEEEILAFVKRSGPLLPKEIAKEFKLDTTFAGAHLSRLVDTNKMKLSSAKIGGSPVYYVQGQEAKLEVLYQHLNDKDQKAHDILKNNKVLRDSDQVPIIRVALRNIKDFAVPLKVNHAGKQEIFWRWYLLQQTEANKLIKEKLNITDKKPEKVEKTIEKEKKETETQPDPKKHTEPVKETVKTNQTTAKEGPDNTNKETENLNKEKEIKETKKEDSKKPEVQKQLPEKETDESQKQEKNESIKTDTRKETKPKDDSFLDTLNNYFNQNNIVVVESEIVRKNSEIDLVLRVPSGVGKLDYYCKARNKKKCNDGDISSAFVQGQLKKLPVLFLTTGDLTKKAKSMVEKEFKNSVVVKKVE